MGLLNMWSLEGDLEKKETSTHVVSLWYIPGGSDYENAKVVHVFFDNGDTAKTFANKWSLPPEMADVFTIDQYNLIRKECSRVFQES